MASLAAGTIVAKSHLALARVIALSFREHHPGIPFFVLLADEVDGFFDPAREPFELIRFDELRLEHAERFRFRHGRQPLTYAATPYLIEELLVRGFERVLFIKEESLVVGDLSSVFALLDRHPIVLTPHLLKPLEGPDRALRELNILQVGVFNVGMVGVADVPEARRLLAWWKDRVYDHCRLAIPEGLHFEQRWMDFAPAFFERVHLLRDPGCNVAHWNLPERRVEIQGADVTVDGEVGRLFRFSGFEAERPERLTKHSDRLTVENAGAAGIIFSRYATRLEAAEHSRTRRWPYAYGVFDNGVPIPEVARQIYRDLGRAASAFGDPFASRRPDSFFHWLDAPEPGAGAAPISRLWSTIYRQRPDVQRAFPDHRGADRRGFLRWAAGPGSAEHGVPEALSVPPS